MKVGILELRVREKELQKQLDSFETPKPLTLELEAFEKEKEKEAAEYLEEAEKTAPKRGRKPRHTKYDKKEFVLFQSSKRPDRTFLLRKRVIAGLLCLNGEFTRKEMISVLTKLSPEQAKSSTAALTWWISGYEEYLRSKGLLSVKKGRGRTGFVYRVGDEEAKHLKPKQSEVASGIPVIENDDSVKMVNVGGQLVPESEVRKENE